jgi:hypothetical protein
MKHIRLCLLFFFLYGLQVDSVLAQNAPPVYRLETTDGNEYVGTITFQTADTVRLKTDKLGVLNFARKDIKSMALVRASQLKAGQYWFDNPQATRYLFSPNGYGLKKGEGYYQNIWVLLNQASVGITNHVSVGFGMVPLFLFSGPTPIWLVPKVSIPVKKDKFNLGAGAAIGTILNTNRDDFGESGNAGFGVLFGLATIGSKDKNISAGLGYGYAGDGLARSPTITISGLIRTGPRGYFITENYIISSDAETVGLIGLGGRRIIKRTGIDFGLVAFVTPDTDGLNALPFLGLTVPFGQAGGTRAAPANK